MKKIMMLTLTALLLLFSALAGVAWADNEYKVMFDGKYVEFTDAQPMYVNGCVMVPVQSLESLGVILNWDPVTHRIMPLKDGVLLSFLAGGAEIQKSESTTTKNIMVTAPFVAENGYTYVSIEDVARAFDYTVGWDVAENTIVIADYAKLFANADNHFSILGKAMEHNAQYDVQQTYKTTADFGLSLSGDMFNDVQVKGNLSALQKSLNADITLNVGVESSAFSDMSEMDAETKQFVELLKNVSLRMKMNGATGDVYINSNLNALQNLDENVWLRMNLFDYYQEDVGLDVKAMFEEYVMGKGQDISLQDALLDTVQQKDLNAQSYAQTQLLYDAAKELLGDAAFTKQETDDAIVYTNTLTGNDILAAFSKNAELKQSMSQMNATDRDKLTDVLKDINLTLKFVEKNGVMVDYDIVAAINLDELKMNFNYVEDAENLDITFEWNNIPEESKLSLQLKAKVVPTREGLSLALPNRAVVMAMDELNGGSVETSEMPVVSEEEAVAVETSEDAATETGAALGCDPDGVTGATLGCDPDGVTGATLGCDPDGVARS